MTKRLRIILILNVRWKEPIFHCTSVWQLYMQICWVNSNLSFEIVSRHLECFSILFKTLDILNKATRNSLKSSYALCYSTLWCHTLWCPNNYVLKFGAWKSTYEQLIAWTRSYTKHLYFLLLDPTQKSNSPWERCCFLFLFLFYFLFARKELCVVFFL